MAKMAENPGAGGIGNAAMGAGLGMGYGMMFPGMMANAYQQGPANMAGPMQPQNQPGVGPVQPAGMGPQAGNRGISPPGSNGSRIP